MKLAEALILRADLQKRLVQIRNRISNNVLIQEGDNPHEDPSHLLREFFSVQDELTLLIKRINKTNNSTKFDEEIMLSDALADRDALLEKRSVYSAMASEASHKQDRYSKSEIKYVSTIDVKKMQKEVDKVSKEYRELDTKIQSLNWTIDLL